MPILNENNEIMFIDRMSNVKNLGKGNLIIYNINGEDRLYLLQNGLTSAIIYE